MRICSNAISCSCIASHCRMSIHVEWNRVLTIITYCNSIIIFVEQTHYFIFNSFTDYSDVSSPHDNILHGTCLAQRNRFLFNVRRTYAQDVEVSLCIFLLMFVHALLNSGKFTKNSKFSTCILRLSLLLILQKIEYTKPLKTSYKSIWYISQINLPVH